jgi:hypothetical protein
MQVIRELGLVLNPEVSLDKRLVISAQMERMCAKSGAFEVARLIREDADENEVPVSVFQGGLRTSLNQISATSSRSIALHRKGRASGPGTHVFDARRGRP